MGGTVYSKVITTTFRNISQLAQRVLCMTHNVLPAYTTLLEQYPIYIAALDQLTKSNAEFRTEIRNFEESSQCYIPLNWILLKILHRIVAWRPVTCHKIEMLLSEGITDADFGPIRVALEKIARFADSTRKQREAITEFVALLQLELDTATQGLLTQPNRVIPFDISPLANLPLLEYKLCMPSVVDRVHHSNCFKLVYSTHEYFFRTNGSYSFHRWTEALRKAAISQVVPDVVTALSLRI
ncbi:unnamed protein product [Haemonchus placei]|uniref:PH domain-containing protein n=1 Tax=Haemonchus placei TaxID=6290 RepID=A0A0N4W201_HAEPC|nr:unnamed protein product [Haemonchus placei]